MIQQLANLHLELHYFIVALPSGIPPLFSPALQFLLLHVALVQDLWTMLHVPFQALKLLVFPLIKDSSPYMVMFCAFST